MSDSNATTVIGPDARFKGEMCFDGSARILGVFEGRIASKGVIEVGTGARCMAAVEASRVVVDGEIVGDVIGHDRVELNTEADVKGDIAAGNLVVVEGASFEGFCRVGPDAVASAGSTRERRASEATPAPASGATAGNGPSIETRSARPASPATEVEAAPATTGGSSDAANLKADWMTFAADGERAADDAA